MLPNRKHREDEEAGSGAEESARTAETADAWRGSLAGVPREAGSGEGRETKAMPRARILVIEDEENIRRILRFQLESQDYEVETAEDGIEGLKRVHLHPPDLILLDVMMPNMDGHEVCRQLKKNVRTQGIPVIMLTAKSTDDDKVAGLGEGANDYLTKPFEMKELVLRVRNMLSWGQVQRGANPLTGLPGNNAIKEEVEGRLASKTPFAFLYIDIDHFKVFNDYYGYGMGDAAIQHTGRVLLESVERMGAEGDFVGHIGGDDFVIVTIPERADAIAYDVIAAFDRTIPSFFRPEDRARGYLEVENRRGEVEKFRFMTLTVAIVSSTQYEIDHYARLSDVASELKRYGKTQGGSTVVRERRVERSEACPAGEAPKPPRP